MACIIEVSLYIYIQWYRDNRYGLSNRQYIFGRPRGRLTSSHYAKYTLYLSQLLDFALLPSTRRSMQFVWILMCSTQAFIDPSNLFGSFWPAIYSCGRTLILCCLSKNRSFPQIFPSDTMVGVAECWCWAVCLRAPPFHHTIFEWTLRWSPRPYSSQFGHTLGGCDQASVEMHLEDAMEQVWRCTWRPWSCELGGPDLAYLEIHLEAVI